MVSLATFLRLYDWHERTEIVKTYPFCDFDGITRIEDLANRNRKRAARNSNIIIQIRRTYIISVNYLL